MLRSFREFLQWRKGDAIILAEANVLPETDMEYFGRDGDRMHMMFNFHVNQHLFYALASGDTRPLAKSLAATKPRPATAQWGLFLRNHDELDLGRLTKAQRETVFKAFGPDKGMQLYDRGIRRRLAPMLGGDRRRLELAYSLMCTLPGTPVIRYGDELAMGDNLDLPERNCARTPMQWSTEPHAGFTESDRPCAPVIDKGPYGYEHVNAAKQRRDPNSMLNWTERIIRMRKEVPEVGWGDFKVITVRDPAVLIIRYDWRNNSVLFVHNLDEKPREFSFAVGLPGETGKLLVNLLTEDHSHANERGTAHAAAGRLRLSLVSRRRPRLSAEAQRHRYRCHGQDQSSCLSGADRGSRPHCRADRACPAPARPRDRERSTAGFRGRSRSNSRRPKPARHRDSTRRRPPRPRLHGDRAGYRLAPRPADRRPSQAAASFRRSAISAL